MADIVPFGKYRGQPIEVMLADQDYVQWCMGQPGLMDMLRQRYGALFNVITLGAAQTDDTPEHNAMQVKFLEGDFQDRFLKAVTGSSLAEKGEQSTAAARDRFARTLEAIAKRAEVDLANREDQLETAKAEALETEQKLASFRSMSPMEKDVHIADHPFIFWSASQVAGEERHKRADQHYQKILADARNERFERGLAEAMSHKLAVATWKYDPPQRDSPVVKVSFEHGYDVDMVATIHYYEYEFGRQKPEEPEWYNASIKEHLRVEIKPQLGDDFPSVLREMRQHLRGLGEAEADVLLIDRFEAKGATLDQVRKVFFPYVLVTLQEVEGSGSAQA